MRRRTLDLAARLVERRLNANHGDRSGQWLPCDGCEAYTGRRGKEDALPAFPSPGGARRRRAVDLEHRRRAVPRRRRDRRPVPICRIRHRFHAAEHLFDVARAVYGHDNDLARVWAEQRRGELLAGDFDDLLRAVGTHAGHCGEARKGRAYFADNRRRMDYPRFRALPFISQSRRTPVCRVHFDY